MTHDDVMEQLTTCRTRSSRGCDGCRYDRKGSKTLCIDTLLGNAADSIGELLNKNATLVILVKESQKTANDCLNTARQAQEIAKNAIALLERAVK